MSERQSRAFLLSLVAGILILINAIAVAAVATWFPSLFPTLPGSSGNDTSILYSVAIIGLFCGILVTLGAMMLRGRPAQRRAWGIIIIAFSAASVITGGGFIIGFIIGIVGGSLALSRGSRTDR